MEATPVILYVDPVCPFAWITSRWLAEVEARRPLRVECRVMSLSVLNEGRELEPWYREFNDRAWGPARVAAAVQQDHGAEAFRRFYEAFGRHHHVGGDRDQPRVLAAALAEAGFAAGLAAELLRTSGAGEGSAAVDDVLRATHDEVRALVGEELGTPVLVVDGAAFFGPVATGIVRGEEAAELFDAVRVLGRCPDFTELKRGRTRALSFT